MRSKKLHAIAVSLLLLMGLSSARAQAVDGVIQGAQCYLHGQDCVQSKNDPRLVLENDFILVSGDKYYFLPNLPRSEKLRAYNDRVRVTGKVTGQKIDVDKLIRNPGDDERVLWDWDEIAYDLYER